MSRKGIISEVRRVPVTLPGIVRSNGPGQRSAVDTDHPAQLVGSIDSFGFTPTFIVTNGAPVAKTISQLLAIPMLDPDSLQPIVQVRFASGGLDFMASITPADARMIGTAFTSAAKLAEFESTGGG